MDNTNVLLLMIEKMFLTRIVKLTSELSITIEFEKYILFKPAYRVQPPSIAALSK